MDKNAIKKYAIWARNELIAKVSQKAAAYGIEKDNIVDANADSIDGVMLSSVEKKQRKALIEQINEKGYEQVIEEVAYTWFNRFTAIRFMEVNGYLPSHIRVFTDDDNNFKPQILAEAIHLNDVFEKINMEKVLELKQENKTEELYKYLLIIQCNALNDVLPRVFQKIEDYSELLLPDYLLREGSVLEQLVTLIPEEDWKDQVQIIGWLYQYYNSEPKDAVFAALKKNVKISKENIPAATQLFTPDWIVRYMVENSLGRLWLEGHPNDELKSEWKYYLDEAEQEEEVQKQLDEIRKEYAQLKPEDIKCIDPCMGSGHILCYMFDVLVKIYEDYGYTARDAASSIVKNNLWGLDIDERAAQLSYFAVMMKARQYDRRFLTKGIQPHVYAIEESNGLRYDGDYGDFLLDKEQQKTLNYIFDVFEDAKEYGSIISTEQRNYDGFLEAWNKIAEQTLSDVRMLGWYMFAGNKVFTLANQAKALSQKYNVVVTNPPYMGMSGMSGRLLNYIKSNFVDSKADLFAVFIERCFDMALTNGYVSMITQHAWMFLSSYERLRAKLLKKTGINMAHLGARAFEEIGGEVVQTTAFVELNQSIKNYNGLYARLVQATSQKSKEELFLSKTHNHIAKQDEFLNIPGSPIAYWVSNSIVSNYKKYPLVGEVAYVKKGMFTGANDLFFRFWYEPNFESIDFDIHSKDEVRDDHYVPMNSGGSFRRWYGNRLNIIKFDKKHYDMITENKGHRNPQFYFHETAAWTKITTGSFSLRWSEEGFINNDASMAIYEGSADLKIIVGLLNSKVAQHYLSLVNESLNYTTGNVSSIPFADLEEQGIEKLVENCIDLSKQDWDSFEISWGFIRHPLVPLASERKEQETSQFAKTRMEKFGLISWHYELWNNICEERFSALKANEEKLNQCLINSYNLHNEIDGTVEDKDVSIRKADVQREVKSLISYAVGCMFGRYSLDAPGLVYAGGVWETSKYTTFKADNDAIIPICDDEYFEDDVVGRFVKFIEVVYGKETLEENLRFIAQALGGKGTSREIIRNYFINEFFADHLKVYQKRPIYWLFDSGKKNGFKCLVYMHRYQSDTIARIRTDYVHEQQSRYRTAIADLEKRIESASTSERVKLNKKLNTLKVQDEELRIYEEKIHHFADQMIEIDLDNGVKVNYAKFQDVLAKIK